MAFVSDLSQNPSQRPKVSSTFPAHCRSSMFYSHSRGRLFAPAELALAQGWPRQERYQRLFPYDRSQLHYREQNVLLGNGMHVATVAALVLYLTSHTVRRSSLSRFPMKSAAFAIRCARDRDLSQGESQQEDEGDAVGRTGPGHDGQQVVEIEESSESGPEPK